MSAAPRLVAADARRVATSLVDEVRMADPGLLSIDGIDLSAAFGQVLFASLRGGRRASGRRAITTWARVPAAVAQGSWPARRTGRGDILVLLLAAVHRQLFAPIADALAAAQPSLAIRPVTAGRGSRDRRLSDLPALAGTRLPRSLLRAVAGVVSPWRFRRATRSWPSIADAGSELLRPAHDSLVRLAIDAARLHATLAAVSPRLVVAYDEIDAWGRLLAAAARRHGIPSLDLPHAEAVDVEAIRGSSYDVMGVFGRHAGEALRAAAVPSHIVEVGASRFDALLHAGRRRMDAPARVVVAGQYLGGLMTDSVSSNILDAALAAAGVMAPAVVQVRPHPVESPVRWEHLVAAKSPPPGVELRVEPSTELQALLPGAAVLVTGWSNSVYEAVLAGVPALTVHVLDGMPPMPFAEEGLSVEARTPAEAAHLARGLVDEGMRREATTRARAALEPHLGPLDGRATKRTADLVRDALAGRVA